MSTATYDVLVAGAGLPGLALAAALSNQGLSVALADRSPVDVPDIDRSTWDARVYAVSPGSVAFLESLGTWNAIPSDRVTAIESMRIEGDEGAVMTFSADDLGERALAWIAEEREMRATLVQSVCDSAVDVLAPGGF